MWNAKAGHVEILYTTGETRPNGKARQEVYIIKQLSKRDRPVRQESDPSYPGTEVMGLFVCLHEPFIDGRIAEDARFFGIAVAQGKDQISLVHF